MRDVALANEKPSTIRSCEVKLLDWIHKQGRTVQYGKVLAQIAVDFQDGVAVGIKVTTPATIEESFR